MRINLNCPYAEKDEAKALGARWDPGRRVWYIVDVEDLAPFSRWIPLLGRVSKDMKTKKDVSRKPRITGTFVPLCNCTTPPWEDCEHTYALTESAMHEMLQSNSMSKNPPPAVERG